MQEGTPRPPSAPTSQATAAGPSEGRRPPRRPRGRRGDLTSSADHHFEAPVDSADCAPAPVDRLHLAALFAERLLASADAPDTPLFDTLLRALDLAVDADAAVALIEQALVAGQQAVPPPQSARKAFDGPQLQALVHALAVRLGQKVLRAGLEDSGPWLKLLCGPWPAPKNALIATVAGFPTAEVTNSFDIPVATRDLLAQWAAKQPKTELRRRRTPKTPGIPLKAAAQELLLKSLARQIDGTMALDRETAMVALRLSLSPDTDRRLRAAAAAHGVPLYVEVGSRLRIMLMHETGL